jgi:hypothetical protein
VSFVQFKAQRIHTFGYFDKWLSSFKDEALTAVQWKFLVFVYIKYGKRKLTDIPAIIVSISRTYNIEIPAVYGILTNDYWQKKWPKIKQ